MAIKSLAVKYRPTSFDEVTEQESIKIILEQQLKSQTVKNAYLFVGGAGTGKTTCARIFARKINEGQGNPIELDAASNNSVDDMRSLIQQAKTKSLDSEYKVFIVDECHMITTAGWNAILKLIEEPPAKSIFIFCTTNPEKIPKTILSRVQRYDFKRISQEGIVNKLHDILVAEQKEDYFNSGKPSPITYKGEALQYIAKIADGGMRDAISMMDKCLSYSEQLTLDNVVKALGTVDYITMVDLTKAIMKFDNNMIIQIVEGVHDEGKDVKRFVKDYSHFLLDFLKFSAVGKWEYLSVPRIDYIDEWFTKTAKLKNIDILFDLTRKMILLSSNIKYSDTAKLDLEAELLLMGGSADDRTE